MNKLLYLSFIIAYCAWVVGSYYIKQLTKNALQINIKQLVFKD